MAARLFVGQTPKEASIPVQSNKPIPKNKLEVRKKRIRDFVFLHDNIHVMSGLEDGTIHKWDLDTGLAVGKPLISKGGRMYAMALSPDGKMIACGRADGSVQQLNTHGEVMLQGIWRCHRNWVRSLSWSPSGGHIASGSFDGEILIRKVESGDVEVGPIQTKQIGVSALAYSPSGEKIASGGYNATICIWNWPAHHNTRLYSASDFFARVFDSESGALLHSLEHDHILFSVTLSPKNNLLACVGSKGVAQLWDTESYQPLGQPFHDHLTLRHVAFSRDGNHLAYCGMDGKVTLWMVEDIVPDFEASTLPQQDHGQLEATQQPEETLPELHQRTQPQSPLVSSFLDVDATGSDGITEEMRDDPYNFFQFSQTTLPATTAKSPRPPNPSPAQRFWKIISRSVTLRECTKHKLLAWRVCSNTFVEPATIAHNQPTPDEKLRAEENDKASIQDADCPINAGLGSNKLEADEGQPRGRSLTSTQSSPAEIWKWSMHTRGKDPTSVSMAPHPEVVEVFAVRGFQKYMALILKRKTKSSTVTCKTPLAVDHTSGSSQPAPSCPSHTLSSQLDCAQRGSVHDSLSATKNIGKQRDDPPAHAQSLPSYDRTLPAHLDSKDGRGLWEQLVQAQGKSLTFDSLCPSTRLANAPQHRIPQNSRHWNSSSTPIGSSRCPVDVAACRDENRYGIVPESDAEAAAAMQRTNDDIANSSTLPGQPAEVAQVSQGRPIQTQASTSGIEEIADQGVGWYWSFESHFQQERLSGGGYMVTADATRSAIVVFKRLDDKAVFVNRIYDRSQQTAS
ncbi:WD40-repeat-containing domain protein [Suillus plorans]|uniref:WD40-repeat-containing domain protein n=1 Tax=Suillus plorans TaxID=116603 RepID=A0A9P7ALT3_9AGAM|nr:WD40-repeat-containing domain protein [Suillus plorans]KAG1791867.1 WD40-repeat-containing domain protein [Suillus plorans]